MSKFFTICGAFLFLTLQTQTYSQGVTTASISGYVSDSEGAYLPNANIIAVHEPSGLHYGTSSRESGLFNIANMKAGGPYTVTVSYVGYISQKQENIFLNLGQNVRLDFELVSETVQLGEVVVTSEEDKVLNSSRTGAVTFVDPMQVTTLPSVKRSTRDLIRLDPRSDGNFSFGGKNWLYNNISLDGSYFNNPFGLDDPAPGGQTNAEPVPYDAVEQVKVSVAPYDVREGSFTGAGINTITKSGTNVYKVSLYSFIRNESFIGNTVSGEEVIANPDLTFNQSGFTASGPILRNKLFLFINGEIERRDDPGSNFVASTTGTSGFGVSRVRASVMDSIRTRMIQVYGYDPGPYQGFIHETNNEKLLAKLDWNVNDNNHFTLRYNYLNAMRDLPPHPFVLSAGGTGRGPNENSLPFQNSGYEINNQLHSFAMEVNSNYTNFANRLFVSYNRFRDFRDPFSQPFPTIEIAENGVTYTTLGHEPFSIHNILDQDVWQVTNNFSYFFGKHVITVGGTFEKFSFFNSFNIFRHGVFFLPAPPTSIGTTFSSLDEFFTKTTPGDSNFIDFNAMIGTGPFKGELIDVGQLAFYAQDEFLISERFNLTFGLRVDLPIYITEPIDNPFSRGLTALDDNDNPETVDQSKLPDVQLLFSPRIGFNLAVTENRSTQLRGGTGIFTGRIPFVWIGNVISNPGANPNLWGPFNPTGQQIKTSDDAILQQSFDLNAMDPDFKWPQVWTTNLAVDHILPWEVLGTLEFIYGKDINAIYVRNADLVTPVRTLPDGRPYYGGSGSNELNSDGGAGIYVIDNTDEGYNFSVSAQFRKQFLSGLSTMLSYTFLQAENSLKSTEIASVLWTENPVQGDPNKPVVSYSEFGNRHRIIGGATYRHEWNENFATSFGLFIEVAEGNRFAGAGGNRYSFTYAGDVNGDGSGANDLIYIPQNSGEIIFDPIMDNGNVIATPQEQWQAFNAFIEQDDYLKENRGKIAERFGAVNPWFSNIDLRLLQDFAVFLSGTKHTFQLSVDILNVANLLNSDWGVRQFATSSATSPLELVRFDTNGAPVFNFNPDTEKTFVDDPSVLSRYQIQIGLRYMFQ